MNYSTPQEDFWAGEFGTDYISRNRSDRLLAANLAFFADILRRTGPIASCIEIGANIGMNLRALQLLSPGLEMTGVEINPDACAELRKVANVIEGSLLDSELPVADLSFTKGVLIHLNPDVLDAAYERLYNASSRFILVAEYYNPAPVVIPYRGHNDRLFKRDFAGELREKYPDLKLIDYGFLSRSDALFPQDDITWFLMEKR